MTRLVALVDGAVLLAALVVAMLPLVPVFGASVLLAPVLGGLALGTVVVLLARRFVWGTAVTVAVALLGYLLVGTAVAVPDLGYARLGPSLASVRALLSGAVTSWKDVLTLDPPLGGIGGVLVAPFVLAAAASVATLRLAGRRDRRTTAAAALVPLAVLLLSVLLGTKESRYPVAAGVGLVLVLGSWASRRAGTFAPRRAVSFIALAAVVAGCGGVTGPWLAEQEPRFVLRDELVPPYDPSTQKSPLSAFRAFVKDWGDTDLLEVSGLPVGARVRLATMDSYDGVVWNVAPVDAAGGSGRFRRVGDVIGPNEQGPTTTVSMTVLDLPFDWLPTVGYTEQLTFASGDATLRSRLRYNDATGSAALVDGVPGGTRYTAQVVVPRVPTDAELDAAAVGRGVLPRPQGVPDAVGEYASQAAGTATSPGLIARSLAEGLSQRGWFSHGLTAVGDYPSLSGHGADRITSLLTGPLMVGDGEQYAAAMALMARQMGLPSRVVLGFVPDVAATEPGTTSAVLTLTGREIQAWVEIDLAGYGWVAFDPTPDPSRTPDDATPQEESAAQPQVRQPPPPPAKPVVTPDDDTEQPRTDDNQERGPAGTSWVVVARVAGAVGIPLVLVLGPPLVVAALKRRRRRSRRGAEDLVEQVVGGWQELCDQAAELRRPLPAHATRREIAVALAGQFAPHDAEGSRRAAAVGGPIAGLATRADAYVFGPNEPTKDQVEAYWSNVSSTVATLRAAVRRRDRWLSRLRVAGRRTGRPRRAETSTSE